ncbi:MFS transporter [Kribbella sp. NPDC051586]|uniref:MFS transporter n=1 Tax=Kribbella sp. NPDC051586 TaxID=3364118 RepID=UPI0037A32841
MTAEDICGSSVESTGGSTGVRSRSTRSPWLPVAALGAGIAVLVTSEFLPASALPTIADDLGISYGTAGLAVAFTAVAGALSAPAIPLMLPRTDRRRVLVALLVLGSLADLAVAVAPDFAVLLAGRMMLGVAIAGFWAFAFGAGVRVLPAKANLVSTVLAVGVSLASVLGVPLAALVDDHLGWRPAFVGVTVACALAASVVWATLPEVPAHPSAGLRMMRAVLGNRLIRTGIVLTVLSVFGNFVAYPYIRLAIGRVDTDVTTALLLTWGIGGVAGSLSAGLIARRLRLLAFGAPALLGASLALTATAATVPIAAVAVGVWGFAFNMVPVAIQLWFARVESERAESAVALSVMAFQIAITIGAATGGRLLDAHGVRLALVAGAVSAVLAGLGFAAIRLPSASGD